MFFIIRYYNESMKVTFPNLENETITELKMYVTQYYKLESHYDLLDLGRIISSDEKLKDFTRNSFTIFIKNL